jgi:hypothetical protein
MRLDGLGDRGPENVAPRGPVRLFGMAAAVLAVSMTCAGGRSSGPVANGRLPLAQGLDTLREARSSEA